MRVFLCYTLCMSTYQRSYNPNRSEEWNYGGQKWKLSRSKIDLFIECPRCFYIDNKLGTKRPNFPPFTLNNAVDELLKREFDYYRERKEPHPLMKEHNIDAIPFSHKNLDVWRDAFAGITFHHPSLDLTVSGGIDDVWITPSGSLIVADYKATSKESSIHAISDSGWEDQYVRQLAIYQWLFRMNEFDVDDSAYFIYCNAKKQESSFDAVLNFEISFIQCTPATNWIEETLKDIKNVLESSMYPAANKNCEYCLYREASGKKLQTIFRNNVGR
jgi:CRISPR/Cas system-associated exonuclease Cas4 (RecB family)